MRARGTTRGTASPLQPRARSLPEEMAGRRIHAPGPAPGSEVLMHRKRSSRRAPGAGHLFTKRDAAGRESWYGKWSVGGRQVKRKLGPKRGPKGHGLDRRAAERKLRALMEEVTPPPASRVGIEEAGRQLIAHLE